MGSVTHIAIILDSSGSMGMIKAATVAAFNDQVKVISAKAKKQKAKVSLAIFSDEVRHAKFEEEAKKISPLTELDYTPSGNTALLDAIGLTIDKLEQSKSVAKKDSVLFVIITDGYENASKLYSHAVISERIKKLQETGQWTFSFIGAEGVVATASGLNIPLGNAVQFNPTAQGVGAMSMSMRSATESYMGMSAVGACSIGSLYSKKNEVTDLTKDEVKPVK